MRRLAVLAPLAIALLAACKVVPASPDGAPLESAGTEFIEPARLGDTVRVILGAGASFDLNRLVVTFEALEEDSRCPANAVCVWAGEARARFRLAAGTRVAKATLQVNTDPRQVEHAGYDIRLVNVEPYPGTVPEGARVVTRALIIVTKR